MSGVTKLMTAGGGGVALTPASSIASDVTVNVPSQNCTLGIQGPAFSAYENIAQTISNTTYTKLSFNTEEFDTASCFNTSTYRFTPTVAGYYQVNASASFGTGTGYAICLIYKNGLSFKNGSSVPIGTIVNNSIVSALVYCNGSTDYIEIYVYQNTGGNLTIGLGAGNTYFQASMVRAA